LSSQAIARPSFAAYTSPRSIPQEEKQMDKMLVVVFDNEGRAYEGLRALKALEAEGSIALYATAVIARDGSKNISVRQAAEDGPLGTAVGLFTGSLLGMFAGPVGFAIAAGTGTMGGVLFDLARSGVSAEFLAEAGGQLEPGKVAVVAEISEEWMLPVDSRMESLGGKVFRQARQAVVDAQIEAEIQARKDDVTALKAELARASAAQKAKVEARLSSAKAKLQAAQARAKSSIEAVASESAAKIALLQQTAVKSAGETRAALEAGVDRTIGEARHRKERLQRAWAAAKKELEA
jgi:uncharacterized membrane protein